MTLIIAIHDIANKCHTYIHFQTFLAIVLCMVALMLQCCVCLSVVVVCMECIVAKRYVPEQKLPVTAYRKSYMRDRLVPK